MNRTLLSLSLNSNKIGDKGAAKIAEVCSFLVFYLFNVPFVLSCITDSTFVSGY